MPEIFREDRVNYLKEEKMVATVTNCLRETQNNAEYNKLSEKTQFGSRFNQLSKKQNGLGANSMCCPIVGSLGAIVTMCAWKNTVWEKI